MLYLARPGDYEKYDIVIAWLAPISLHKEWCKQKSFEGLYCYEDDNVGGSRFQARFVLGKKVKC